MSFRLRVTYVGAYCSFTSSEHWFHARSYSEKEFSKTDVLNPPGSTTATLQPNGFRERLHNQQAALLTQRQQDNRPVVKVGGNARERRSWAPKNGCKRSWALCTLFSRGNARPTAFPCQMSTSSGWFLCEEAVVHTHVYANTIQSP